MAAMMAEEGRLHVLENREPAEDAGDLERAADPAPAEILGGEPAHLLAPEVDLARVVREVARDQVEEGRLPGAVGADDGAQVAVGHVQIHPVHGLEASEVLLQAHRLED